jgi:hypothetical protein
MIDDTCNICGTTERLGFDYDPSTDERRGTVCFACKVDIRGVEHTLELPTLDVIKTYLSKPVLGDSLSEPA